MGMCYHSLSMYKHNKEEDWCLIQNHSKTTYPQLSWIACLGKAIELSREILNQVLALKKDAQQYFGQDLIDLILQLPSLIANGFSFKRSKSGNISTDLKQGLRNVVKIETSIPIVVKKHPSIKCFTTVLVDLRKCWHRYQITLTKPAKEQAETTGRIINGWTNLLPPHYRG